MKLSLVVAGFVGFLAAACADGAAVETTPPAGAGAGASATCGATPLAAGCETSKTSKTSTSTPVAKSSPVGDVCLGKTCEDFKGACGSHDDGCGGSFSCGSCVTAATACAAKTCADLGATCGNHDNGCGATVSCGACATTCATDAKEPNDTNAQATYLGELTDTDAKTIPTTNLDSADGDVDWFKLSVTDGTNFTNPKIEVTSTDALLEISVFHECFSLPNYSYCYSDGTQETNADIGNGCTAQGHVIVKTDCAGEDESGTAFIRVQKNVSDGTCHNYDLSVHVY